MPSAAPAVPDVDLTLTLSTASGDARTLDLATRAIVVAVVPTPRFGREAEVLAGVAAAVQAGADVVEVPSESKLLGPAVRGAAIPVATTVTTHATARQAVAAGAALLMVPRDAVAAVLADDDPASDGSAQDGGAGDGAAEGSVEDAVLNGDRDFPSGEGAAADDLAGEGAADRGPASARLAVDRPEDDDLGSDDIDLRSRGGELDGSGSGSSGFGSGATSGSGPFGSGASSGTGSGSGAGSGPGSGSSARFGDGAPASSLRRGDVPPSSEWTIATVVDTAAAGRDAVLDRPDRPVVFDVTGLAGADAVSEESLALSVGVRLIRTNDVRRTRRVVEVMAHLLAARR